MPFCLICAWACRLTATLPSLRRPDRNASFADLPQGFPRCHVERRDHDDVADDIKRMSGAACGAVENKDLRRHDTEAAQRIIDRHPIMHGIGMAVEDMAVARDIADALAGARGEVASDVGHEPTCGN
jgi:hypothetical protein